MLDMFSAATSISKSLDKLEEASKQNLVMLAAIERHLSNMNKIMIELMQEKING